MVSRSLNSPFSLPKAAISVGQTKVKSFGQKKTIFHLPGLLSLETGWNAWFMSSDTTPVNSKRGNVSPTVNIIQALLKGWCTRQVTVNVGRLVRSGQLIILSVSI